MSDSNLQRRRGMALLCLLLLYLASYTAAAAPPVVSNVRAAQRSGTGYVDITYDLSDPDNSSLSVTVAVSTDAGATWSYPSASLAGKVGSGVSPGAGKQVAWNAGSDLPAKLFANVRVQVTAGDAVAPSGMALIPAGNFTMGNCMDPSEGSRDELPLHTVYVSAFYMDKYLVTKSLWDTVYQWAIAHGYTFDHAGSGTASTYPVQRIDWYDCVKWCNARSEKEGRTPAYYTDAGLGVGYRTGQVTPYVRWSSGYRLPTEAEWEKAARGRASGHRFPWSDADTITHSRANYFSSHSYSYDVSPTRLYHPAFSTGTSPVGYFAANGYGLYDMAGNVWQWCWDWHGSYSSGSQSDPRGPPSGPYRVRRGGSLGCYAIGCRAANRYEYGPTYGVDHGLDGFRSVLPPGQAGSSTATSPIFAVDTRAVSTGTLTGLVQGNGTPVVNAQVRIDGTPFTASTDANGRFTLANVPAGSGYLLKVSAAGFAPKQVPGVTVTSGTTDKGTIQLATLNGPCRIIPLQPDVNPVLTQIEDGGVAYRYYKVVAADGKTPAVSANIELRMVAGGTVIPQTGDVSDYWPGKVAGMPDADGILRLRIPASSMLLLNSAWSFQVLESGVVQQTFQAQAVPRQYDQVWKHKVGVGIGGKLGVAAPLAVKGEGRQAYSTEIRQTIAGGQVGEERIKRTRDVELRAGLEVESPGIVLLGGGAKASAGAGVLGGGELSSEYNFNSPTTDDSYENALKVYLTLGDDFSCAGNPLTFGLYDGLRTAVEPYFLGDKLMSAEGEARLGVYGDASAQLGWKLGKTAGVGLAAEFSAETYAMAGVEQTYQPSSETVLSLGCGASVSASAQAGVFFSKKSPKKGFDLSGLSLFIGADGESRCKLHFPNGNRFATQVELEQSVGVSPLGVQLNFGPYQIADTSLYSEYTQDLSLDLPSAAAYQRLLSESPHWNAAAQGGAGLTLKPDLQANLMEDLLNLANETLNSATYDLSVYMADKIDADVGGDLLHVSIPGIGTLGLSGDVAFSVERGIEAVEEHGRLWQITKRLPLESYPKLTASQLPSETIVDKERRWVGYASLLIRQILKQAVSTVANTANNIVQAGEKDVGATLTFAQDVMTRDSQIVTTWVAGLVGGGVHPKDKNPPTILGPLPPVGASNYVYGVSGIYRFASSNSFNGTGTLAIAYSAAQAAGLYEADFRIYRLDENTNRWVLIGGMVDMVSNLVSVTISNLGTYAVAPPLPTGSLWLQPSTNSLPADGVSQMTVMVNNLLLNTGGSATQAWLFTASAVGADILSSDADTNTPGVQVVSTNATLRLQLRAPVGGTYASVSLRSVAGDAYGQVGINLVDNTPPGTPTNVSVTAGQSRIWVSWQTNREPDLAAYRVYYRAGAVGSSWDGTATVEGAPSPVQVVGTNVLLRGLALGTNYFVAVSAVDTTGNESPLSPTIQVATAAAAPAPPTAVAASFGPDGTNILMWALSEDDGYNDRDVLRYDVFRAVLPGGSYLKVGEASAGIGLYSETNTTVGSTQYVGYAVTAVATGGISSPQALASRLMADGVTLDNDGDGIPDWWLVQYFGHPVGQASDQSLAWNDPAGDGLSNLQKYLLGLNPLVPARPYLQPLLSPTNGDFALNVQALFGRSVTLEVSTDLTNWQTLTNLTSTNAVIYFEDWGVTNSGSRFYRAVVP